MHVKRVVVVGGEDTMESKCGTELLGALSVEKTAECEVGRRNVTLGDGPTPKNWVKR